MATARPRSACSKRPTSPSRAANSSPSSPLRAPVDELRGLPDTLLIVDENDVLRDEGEAYGRKLIEAGVNTTLVRYDATIHDFMMLNPLRSSAASTAAIEQAIHTLRKTFDRH